MQKFVISACALAVEALRMNARALVSLCAISASCLLATQLSQADPTAAAPGREPGKSKANPC